MSKKQISTGFDALNVPAELCSLLAKHEIVTPTAIQAEAIPPALYGNDLIGIAQTGTGKTLAFGLPMATNLKEGEIGLVLAPTRELAQQIAETFYKLNNKCVLIVGGAAMGAQISLLRLKHDVIVATPGRLIDHMDRGTVNLSRVKIVVLDEADRMLDMGFAPAIRRIMESVPTERQTMLFSATMPDEIKELADSFLTDPMRIEIESENVTPDLIDQQLIFAPFDAKYPVLNRVLDHHDGSVLVFTRTKHGARKAAKAIRDMGHSAVEIHSDRTLAQRRAAMAGFKKGDYRILVATDIASRGIDVKDIELVVNYDLPDNPEDYIHRIGRTGRAGSKGRAITIAMPQQKRLLRDIQQLIGMEIPPLDLAQFETDGTAAQEPIQCDLGEPMPQHEDSSNGRPERRDQKPRYQNNRNDRPEPRRYDNARDDRPPFRQNRDDRPQERNDRPAPRRYDDRDQKPRFQRDERPYQPRERRNDDRPAPQDRPFNNRDERPRYGQNRDDRPYQNRDNRYNDRPAPRQYDNDRPRYGQNRDERPYQNRDNRYNDRPAPRRYDNDREQRPPYQRDERPYQNRDNRYSDRPEPRRFEGGRDERPRYRQDDRPYQNRERRDDRDRPNTYRERYDGPRDNRRDDRPPFRQNRDDRPRGGFDRRNDDRPAPRDRRDEKPRYGQDRPYEKKDRRFEERPPKREFDRDQKPRDERAPKPQAKPRKSTAPTGFNGKPTNRESTDRFTPKKFKVRVKPKHSGRKRK